MFFFSKPLKLRFSLTGSLTADLSFPNEARDDISYLIVRRVTDAYLFHILPPLELRPSQGHPKTSKGTS